MSYTIGDGIATTALAGAFVGYQYLKHKSRAARLEVLHKERLVAMEKGIPLPELPPDPESDAKNPDPDSVLPILGTVLFTLSVGTMIVIYVMQPSGGNGFWVAPLPFAFMGAGLVVFHLLRQDANR